MKTYRHGDVIIREIEELPKGLNKTNTNKLAEGEYTGHSHRLLTKDKTPINILTDVMGNIYIDIKEDAIVTHQEHSTIELAPSQYEVIIKRNYDPFEQKIKEVRD